VAGLPVPAAVNMVWLVAHTTVRATKAGLNVRAAPVVKKRHANVPLIESPRPTVA
jgi:hypothetical protein